jgi:hypothetical protein
MTCQLDQTCLIDTCSKETEAVDCPLNDEYCVLGQCGNVPCDNTNVDILCYITHHCGADAECGPCSFDDPCREGWSCDADL